MAKIFEKLGEKIWISHSMRKSLGAIYFFGFLQSEQNSLD